MKRSSQKRITTIRVDDQMNSQIEYLKHQLQTESTTHVLKEAISFFYSFIKKKKSTKTPFELMEELHLIGCLEGEKDLSTTYKQKFTKSLQKKHHSLKSTN